MRAIWICAAVAIAVVGLISPRMLTSAAVLLAAGNFVALMLKK